MHSFKRLADGITQGKKSHRNTEAGASVRRFRHPFDVPRRAHNLVKRTKRSLSRPELEASGDIDRCSRGINGIAARYVDVCTRAGLLRLLISMCKNFSCGLLWLPEKLKMMLPHGARSK